MGRYFETSRSLKLKNGGERVKSRILRVIQEVRLYKLSF